MAERVLTRVHNLHEPLDSTLATHRNDIPMVMVLSRIDSHGEGILKPHQLIYEFDAICKEDQSKLLDGDFHEVLKCTQWSSHGRIYFEEIRKLGINTSDHSCADVKEMGKELYLHQSLTRNRTMEKKDDACLHIAIRTGDLGVPFEILSNYDEEKLLELLLKKNQSSETPLYVAVEYGCVDLVREMIKYYDSEAASIKAKNGLDAFHIATRQGSLGVVNSFKDASKYLEVFPDHVKNGAFCILH
ncbi:hypothetical protein L6452_20817 [Arctium lappa]|uniref:Uncharacterized protein n=1 Tax=Arctium lappa TaxID=4217 RepID=A0ACB9BDQ7_ARCLA|nr:hypothetical protein L6452_20817 [Arctium lappa]